MALDNAQFISELSITDPPGTDAVAEGDDHIRTTKRATQQSFPNVDAAVPQTAAQMGQMAIKNEVNLFTQANTFEGVLTSTSSIINAQALVGGGGQSDIRYLNQAGDQRWVLRVESDVAGNDWTIHRRDAVGAAIDVPFRIDATTGFSTFVKTVTFLGDPTIIRNAFLNIDAAFDSDRGINFQDIGVSRWSVIMGSVTSGRDFKIQRRSSIGGLVDTPILLTEARGQLLMTIGRAGDPAYSFQDNPNMGMFRVGADILGFATAGISRITLGTQASFTVPLVVPDGSSTAPSYSFTGHPNAGMFIQAGANLGFSAGGVRRFLVKSNTCNMNLPSTNAGLSSGDCFVSSGFVAIVP